METTPFQRIVAATAAGIVTTAIGHPLDTIKVHLQTNPSIGSTTAAANHLLTQGVLFRGILPPLCNAVIMNTVMFSVFHGVKDLVQGDDDDSHSLANSLLAGTISGFLTACISTPTDYFKIRAQLNRQRSVSLRNVFRGHVANLGREGVFTMVYLGLYDRMSPSGFPQIAAASSVTGGLAWIASYPFDTIKTVMQSSSSLSYRQALAQIGNGYYRGCGASTGRAMLVTSLRMIVYEMVLQFHIPPFNQSPQ